MSTDLVPRRCALYRHFDRYDVLLYVGISETPVERTNSHARTSEWVQYAARAEAQWFPSRAAASQSEQDAIRTELPVFNRQYATGDVDRRIADYVRDLELKTLQAKVKIYEYEIRQCIERAPKEVREVAEAKARLDFPHAGGPADETFLSRVLANLMPAMHYHFEDSIDRHVLHALLEVSDRIVGTVDDLMDRINTRDAPKGTSG